MERTCLECGEKLRGRADQKFCSPQCRSSYNNRENREEAAYLRQVNKVLKKNRDILTRLNTEGNTKEKRIRLYENGFRFDFVTHKARNQDGTTTYFCYDQGFMDLDDDYVLLLNNKKELF